MGTEMALNAMQIAHRVFAPAASLGKPDHPPGEERSVSCGLALRKWIPGTLSATLAARLPAL